VQVLNFRPAPVAMVPPRSGRGWGREGFATGKRGRGDGRGGVKVMHGGALAEGEGGVPPTPRRCSNHRCSR
jgi:hypothetical protein